MFEDEEGKLKHEEWLRTLNPGDIVCDCRYVHSSIKSIDLELDEIIMEDGFDCSPIYCIDPVPHPNFEHEGTEKYE